MNTKTELFAHVEHEADVCVVGGGMAGMCAAIAAARNGAKTVLMHDRAVLGGNASSEIRMWICGAHGEHNKETGILEEIQLANLSRNAMLSYSVWDSVLWERIAFEPNLTPILNCSCLDAEIDDTKNDARSIVAVRGWQLTSQTWQTVYAKQFIDCSGDSVLAPLSGAACRWGRESRDEFNEDIEPAAADRKTMGNSLLIQLRKTDEPHPFTPPRWAYRFDSADDLPNRMRGVSGHNFWWIEVGGIDNTIHDAEQIRDELMKIVWGVWDYIKNRADERDKAANWAIEWVGSLPGKRENRRYEGDHIMTQHDVRAADAFDDVVAYGGWSMDDHHPAGLLYPGKPTLFHAAPSPYAIPYRSLYSRNVANLFCAGRNISVTHAALSSTRVMATCAVIGQAAGAAAALCVAEGRKPRDLASGDALRRLQHTLMDDDCWLPGRTRPLGELQQAATPATPQGDEAAGNITRLRDGHERDRPDAAHAWEGPLGSAIEHRWDHDVPIGSVRLVLDSNLNSDKRMPCSYPQKADRCLMPDTLLRSLRIETQDAAGDWHVASRLDDIDRRLLWLPIERQSRAIRLVPETTWGADVARVFAFEPRPETDIKITPIPVGRPYRERRAEINPADLAPPDSGLESPDAKTTGSA